MAFLCSNRANGSKSPEEAGPDMWISPALLVWQLWALLLWASVTGRLIYGLHELSNIGRGLRMNTRASVHDCHLIWALHHPLTPVILPGWRGLDRALWSPVLFPLQDERYCKVMPTVCFRQLHSNFAVLQCRQSKARLRDEQCHAMTQEIQGRSVLEQVAIKEWHQLLSGEVVLGIPELLIYL